PAPPSLNQSCRQFLSGLPHGLNHLTNHSVAAVSHISLTFSSRCESPSRHPHRSPSCPRVCAPELSKLAPRCPSRSCMCPRRDKPGTADWAEKPLFHGAS